MSAEDQLSYENRVRNRQTGAAVAAAIFIVAAAIIQLSGVHTKVEELTLDLITEHKRYTVDLIGSIINAIGLGFLAWTLSYLWKISHARKPDVQPFIRYLSVVGGVLSGVAAVVYEITIADKAGQFVKTAGETYQEAHALTHGGLVVVMPLVAQAASLLLTAGFIWVSLNAMRVGLLTRFMGYLGIFAGVLVLFPIGSPVPVVQGFWLLAVAYLISGRWPSGLPPAWTSGELERWPTSAEVREQREQTNSNQGTATKTNFERTPKGKPEPKRKAAATGSAKPAKSRGTPSQPDEQPVTTPATPANGRPQGSSQKRKRKRRR